MEPYRAAQTQAPAPAPRHVGLVKGSTGTPEEREESFAPLPVRVYGRECPEPVAAPEQLRRMLSPHAFAYLESRSRAFPTPTQTHAIPIVFAGRDALVVADTRDLQYVAAFVAPILSLLHQRQAAEHVTDSSPSQEPRTIHPRAIIVAHNPGWAKLLLEETRRLEGSGSLHITLLSLSDAEGHGRDDVLITTLSDLIRSLGNKRASLRHVEFFVIHGLDWLLDGGYDDQIAALVHEIESKCQIVLLSAVLPRAVLDLETRLLQARGNNVRLIVGGGPAAGKPIPHVPMRVHHEEDRLRALIDILPSSSASERVLILTSSPKCDRHLHDKLASKHLQASVLSKEADVWQDAEDSRILITNDYMLRGFKGSAWRIKPKHLINYELPDDIDLLVHRMGRVGMPFSVADDHPARITTFVTSANARSTALPDLVELLLENQQEVPLWLKQLADAAPKPTHGSRW